MPHTRRSSSRVDAHSHAPDPNKGLFQGSPEEIGRALKRCAERNLRRKSDPFPSAMSMLNFYINRAGHQLSAARRDQLEAAKDVLRELFHRPTHRAGTHHRSS